jgi:hypothetical protein
MKTISRLKGVNFNCKILFGALIFSFVPIHVKAQQYFNNDHAYYLLEDSVHFYYSYGGFCGTAPSGKGTYTKKGNKITFQFSPKKSSPNITLTEYPLGKNTGDDFKLKIICLEDSVNSFPFVNIYYLDSMNKKIGSSTNMDGICEFNIDAENFKDTIFIRYPGIANIDIPILPLSQNIEIILPFESPFEIHDKVEVFRIGRKNKLVPVKN